MKTISASNAKLLFVIDNDFGALGLALYFLHRQPVATNATILMPEWLYQKQAKYLPVQSQPYSSYQDILDIAEVKAPDIVFLFSGYLLASVKLRTVLTDIREFENFLTNIRKHNCQLVTTDPYLGTFQFFNQFPKQNNKLAKLTGGLSELIRAKILLKAIRRISFLLQDIKHLHAVPSPNAVWNKLDNISFYNKHYLRSKNELAHLSASLSANVSDDERLPKWLFVLARFDLDYQIEKYGRETFYGLVVEKLTQAQANEREAILIAPQELVDALAEKFQDQDRITLLAECAFDEFEKHLLTAEAVFYWQVFSTSTFLRLLHGLPVFCFDLGHSASLSQMFHETCLKHYYLGKSPVMLDITEPLEQRHLTEFNQEFVSMASYLNSKFSASSSPHDIIEAILNNRD